MEPRMVYFVSELERNPKGEYIALIAVEGETGFYRTDWYWSADLKLAQQIADERNACMGIGQHEAFQIILGTMRSVK